MTKADLARAVYERHGGLTNREALRIVDTIFDIIRDRLIAGDSVRIVGFGTIETVDRRPRCGRNPSTGEEIRLPRQRALVFRQARGMKSQ
jgi:nucleoid DNA-binding protein